MASLEEMRKAVEGGITRILTLERVKGLTGKRIATIYFDFRLNHLPQVDEFVIGEIKSEYDLHDDKPKVLKEFKDKPHLIKKMKSTYEILTQDNRRTFLKATATNSGIFTGPDDDYEVWFKEM